MLPLAWQRGLLAKVLGQAFARLAVFGRADNRGDAAREAFTRAIGGQVRHYRFVGLDLGFTYEAGAFVAEGSPKPLAEDPVIDYRPTTWPSARLPHFRVEQGGLSQSIHDFVEANRFLLLTDELGAQPWWEAIAALGEMGKLLRCLVVGPGADADLRDHGAWRSLSEVDPGGAVLVRPDGHVGWRARSLPDAPASALKAALLEILRPA